ncbi:hypothetical protein [Caulobacter hibisci]|uniref:Uncharacterized protein n=1 Tax=Caulobacter hibisci TaxID=2035993 RepID=A0ABS0SUG4_9CAUL|nr:hypothetical protein [Caulobacter hibisci]MBI1683285.1 hypothetical protein [Caulobacter hibisci]
MTPFFPPPSLLETALGVELAKLEGQKKVEVHSDALRYLIQLALNSVATDPIVYGQTNPDLAKAFDSDPIELKRHFSHIGYFEGRQFPYARFDSSYYLRSNPDVAAAFRTQAIRDPRQHFVERGVYEMRSPNEGSAEEVNAWAELVKGKPSKSA